jgi:hypothetical protein
MIQMDHMAHFMDHHVINDFQRGHGQLPIECQLPSSVASAPCRFTVRNANGARFRFKVVLMESDALFN